MSGTIGASTPAATINSLDEKTVDATPTGQVLVNERHTIPYWQVNVPPSQRTAECPSYLRDLPAKSIRCLSTLDEDYTRQDWDEVREIVRTNRIDRFQRVPSELRRYLAYMAQLKTEYSSVMKFVVQERLHWGGGSNLAPKGRPFEFNEDICILYNDWPYGVETDIIHLVVWTKFELEDDPATDDLTASSRAAIEAYVQRTFCSRVPPVQVVWFKNWRSLKSVHAVEHFHVMLYRPDMAFVKEITHGDVPLIARLR